MLVAGPGTVVGLVPWWITRWRLDPPLPGILPLRFAGVALLAAGAFAILDSFVRFVVRGRGTPAPPLPPTRLVATGLYRHVRNPMYLAILGAVAGQALLFGSVALLAYALALWGAFHAFVIGYEEPRLRRTFGEEYGAFVASVPRWLPRLRPWKGTGR
jgi:protein-S-isoprenylcysteine O-methyltransferase Ste14